MPKLRHLVEKLKPRSDQEARNRFNLPLTKCLSTVTNSQWNTLTQRDAELYQVSTNLDTNRGKVYLTSAIRYVIVDNPDQRKQKKVKTLAFTHSFTEDEQNKYEIVSWHWHPNVQSVKYPHIHVGKGFQCADQQDYDLHKLHIPSGRVSFEEVLAFGINELGVRPLSMTKAEALEVITESNSIFKEHRTWN